MIPMIVRFASEPKGVVMVCEGVGVPAIAPPLSPPLPLPSSRVANTLVTSSPPVCAVVGVDDDIWATVGGDCVEGWSVCPIGAENTRQRGW
jgi:hypothetical protein